MEVLMPTKFDRDTLGHLFQSLDNTRDIDDVNINFSKLRYSFPTAMLVAGSKLRDWVDYRSICGYESTRSGINSDIRAHSYLMHMGFFDFIYMDEGNRVGEAKGSSNYLPITRIQRPSIDAIKSGVDRWYAAVEEEARKLAGVLCNSYNDCQALRTYTYSIREIIRNVFEHSHADECFICGQRWMNGKVEIALIDEGIGISKSLSESYPIMFDEEALSLATQAGISRTSSKDSQQNIYDNSGFGLYILSQFAASFGWFILGSGSAQLIGHEQNRIHEPSSFQGTFFGMQLQHTPRDFASVLNDIIESGEEEAKAAGIATKASGRSRLIS